jgi:hypothetical protein
MQVFKGSLLLLQVRCSPFDSRLVQAGINADQRLSPSHELIVVEKNFRHEAGHLRRQGRGIAADIGVIGGLHPSADVPPIDTVRHGENGGSH